jgi:hypothetical protein
VRASRTAGAGIGNPSIHSRTCYNLIFNNCQHFARWCATGDHESEQVRSVGATAGTVITPLVATGLTATVIAPAGVVAGLSGPEIMSGLATYGALAGGGAVAGLVVLGVAPAPSAD